MFNKILFATDGSDLSRQATHEAIHLAKSIGAKNSAHCAPHLWVTVNVH
jgi:nucleotide-binding universal stress UspA family protein